MIDLEIFAPDMATMQLAAQTIGAWHTADPNDPNDKSSFVEGTRDAQGNVWALNVYGTKYLWDGTTVSDGMGGQTHNMVAQPGVYAIARWIPADGVSPPPSLPASLSAVTVNPLPANSPIRWE